jgi:hypothetical protein
MKSLKWLISVATACLLVGASGMAMAVDCSEGAIENIPVAEITLNGQSCFINNVTVEGDIVAVNSEEVTILNGSVGGRVRLIGGRNATMVGVAVVGNITARSNERANLALNGASNIRVINNDKAVIKRNGALGIIQCRGNRRLDAFENEAAEVRCRALGGGLGGPDGIGGF